MTNSSRRAPSLNEYESPRDPAERLKQALAFYHLDPLHTKQYKQFTDYLSLILRWNLRTNLTAVRDQDDMLLRHFIESIACAQALPAGIHTLLDFGSGAGFPGIPIGLCRPEIAVTLAESQGKKAAFLREAARVLDCSTWSNPIRVHAGRAEMLHAEHFPGFDCVTLRAVDKMEQALRAAAQLVRPGGFLAPMTTTTDLPTLQAAAGPAFTWNDPILLPGGESRILALGQKSASPAA